MKRLQLPYQIGAAFAFVVAGILPVSAQSYLPEQRPGWCKNEVMSRYNTYGANVSITGTQDSTVTWRINDTGRTGRCIFNSQNALVRLEEASTQSPYRATGSIYWDAQARRWIGPDGLVCNTCTPANGFPTPPVTQGGFFYMPNSQQWYDPDGRVCNTCNPRNGFPIPPQASSVNPRSLIAAQCGAYDITVASSPDGRFSYQSRSRTGGNLSLTGGTAQNTEGVRVYKFRNGNTEYWVWQGTLDNPNAVRLETYQNNRILSGISCVRRT